MTKGQLLNSSQYLIYSIMAKSYYSNAFMNWMLNYQKALLSDSSFKLLIEIFFFFSMHYDNGEVIVDYLYFFYLFLLVGG